MLLVQLQHHGPLEPARLPALEVPGVDIGRELLERLADGAGLVVAVMVN
jgi:hypothetical protein